MKKLLFSLLVVTIGTLAVKAQDKGGNAGRDARDAREPQTKDVKEPSTKESNREPAMGKADQRGRVNEELREWKKGLDEAGKTQSGGERSSGGAEDGNGTKPEPRDPREGNKH